MSDQLSSEALLYAGKARTMAAKLFNDPQASQVDAGDLLIYMAQLVDQLCLAATPAAPAHVPEADFGNIEPVAWGMRDKTTGLILDVICPDEHDSHEGDYTIPLYATPAAPAPVPLTDEQIIDLLYSVYDGMRSLTPITDIKVARAIERAHGIGQGKEVSK